MNTGSQTTVDGRPALRFERHLPQPIERVWRAVSEPAELERWFVAVVPWTPVVGETFEAHGQTAEVLEVGPPHTLAWTWGDEHYRFELTEDSGGTRLVFVHVFTPDFGPDWQHAAGWETYFERLDAHLDGGFLSEEEAHVGIEARKARYREAFTVSAEAPGAPPHS